MPQACKNTQPVCPHLYIMRVASLYLINGIIQDLKHLRMHAHAVLPIASLLSSMLRDSKMVPVQCMQLQRHGSAHHVVEPTLASAPYIHSWSLPDWIQSFQHLQVRMCEQRYRSERVQRFQGNRLCIIPLHGRVHLQPSMNKLRQKAPGSDQHRS